MSNVVEFQSPTQLRKMLADRDEEVARLKAEVMAVTGTKEMLKLQILDLKGQVVDMVGQMGQIQQNLTNLMKKLDS